MCCKILELEEVELSADGYAGDFVAALLADETYLLHGPTTLLSA